MNVYIIVNSAMEENTYLVYDGATRRGFLVDPGSDTEETEREIKRHGAIIEAVLLTHGHFDHALSAKYFQDKGVPIYIHRADADKLYTRRNLGVYIGYKFQSLNADRLLDGGEKLSIAGFSIEVIHTPGHSKGGACYLVDGLGSSAVLFSGDTLFSGDIGRSDFYDGDFEELKSSIKNKLFTLEPGVTVFPGHGARTTVKAEAERGDSLFEE